MPIAVTTKKRSLLPLLTVLFVLSYGLMTLLIVEQGSVIQSQRNLIKVLSRDSSALWSERGKAIGDQQTAQSEAKTRTQTQAPTTQAPTTQAPTTQEHSAQTPSTQNRSTQTPSTQVAPQHRSQSRIGKTAKPGRQLPPEPASDLVDRRRSLNSI
jgi:uncharacterized membrane protein